MNPDFFNEETRHGFFIDAKRKRLWAVELAILEVVLDICARHNLRYFAIDGTLLGAVRHKGFIPWDDDIDIGMPRPDFERFLQLAPGLLPPHLSLHFRRTNPRVPWPFYAKIRNCHTTFIQQDRAHLDIHHGVNIDIFPMDGLPRDEKDWRNYRRRRTLLNRLDRKIRSTWKTSPSWRSKLLLLPFLAIKRLFGENIFHNRLEKLFMEYDFDDTDLEIHCRWLGADRGMRNRRHFDDVVLLDFEHLKLRCPAGYHAYLTEHYGDYMQFPPPDKRGNWHIAFFDPDRPYTDYAPYARCFEAADSQPSTD